MRLLIRNGTVLDTEPATPLARAGHDVLVEDGRIAAVGVDLPAAGAELLDATNCLVLPGFVDTHRHVWQAMLRARVLDDDLAGYLALVRGQVGPMLGPADVRAGTLAGALECLDAGITTVQDYCHAIHSPAHADAAVDGLRAAGIRAVFSYGLTGDRPDGRQDARRVRAEHFAGGDGLLTMLLSPSGYAPIDAVEADWRLADELGVGIAVHLGATPAAPAPVTALGAANLLWPGTIYVHGNSLPDAELTRLADSGGVVAIAPGVEARMGHGAPMVGRLRAAGIPTGLGVDVVTTVAGDMFSLMRATLTSGDVAGGPRLATADLLRLATIEGARVLGLDDRIGSLRPGKAADVVLLRTDAVNMLAAANDPVGAVVTAAHPGNVDTVLVNGVVRKRAGRLVDPVPELEPIAARLR